MLSKDRLQIEDRRPFPVPPVIPTTVSPPPFSVAVTVALWAALLLGGAISSADAARQSDLAPAIVAAQEGAAAAADSAADEPESLEARVRAYWQARVAGDLVTMYNYEKIRADGDVSLAQYVRASTSIVYKNAKVLNTEIVGEREAVANLIVEYKVIGLPGEPLKTKYRDSWVKIDGVWYHGKP